MAELVCRPDQHAAWLDARRQGVTATDVVTLAGLCDDCGLFYCQCGETWDESDGV